MNTKTAWKKQVAQCGLPVKPWMENVARTRPVSLYEVWRVSVGLRERLELRTESRFNDEQVARLVDGCATLATAWNLPFMSVAARLGGRVSVSLAKDASTPEQP